jgi:dynein heavy chain
VFLFVQSILFGLCHFHSVIIERIKFGSKGWNKPYPFNTGDLMCSATVLANYLEAGQSADRVPWSDLRYIFGDILYGGHITGEDTHQQQGPWHVWWLACNLLC